MPIEAGPSWPKGMKMQLLLAAVVSGSLVKQVGTRKVQSL
jgi:hypothetical protein